MNWRWLRQMVERDSSMRVRCSRSVTMYSYDLRVLSIVKRAPIVPPGEQRQKENSLKRNSFWRQVKGRGGGCGWVGHHQGDPAREKRSFPNELHRISAWPSTVCCWIPANSAPSRSLWGNGVVRQLLLCLRRHETSGDGGRVSRAWPSHLYK